jgi:ubiquinone/menaquinone biosynthesis C-methylase UbiE
LHEEEQRRQAIYNQLHQHDQLRFPLEDYPTFVSWLHIPANGAGLRLLDIACGQGFFLAASEPAAEQLELHGVDFSELALQYARGRVKRSILQLGSAYDLPYPNEYFDYCVNLGSLEHFDQPDLALRELRRVLKPSGKAMIIVPNQYYVGTIWKVLAYGEGETQGQEGVTYFRTLQEWTELFLKNSLDVTGVTGYSGVDHIAWYFKRQDGKISDQERLWRQILDTWLKPVIPLNLAQCFVFSLRCQPG